MSDQQLMIRAQFNRAWISEEDFKEAESYLNVLTAEQSSEVKSALLLSAIVSYARPFLKNKSVNGLAATATLKLRPNKDLTPDEYLMHKYLLNLRNKTLAHSDYEMKPVRWSSGSENGFFVDYRQFSLLAEPLDPQEFQRLCRKLKMHCARQSMALSNRLAVMCTG
jgi:hypothetical protein